MSIETEGEEDAIGTWMIEEGKKFMVECRIACDELGYPVSEARYSSIADFEQKTGSNFYELLSELL